MKIEEMQNEWKMVKSSPRSHGELRKMMYASPVRRMRRMQWREKLSLSQTLVAFVVVLWVTESLKEVPTAVLACWLLYTLLDQYLGLRYFSLLPNKATVHKTLTNSLSKLEDALILSHVLIQQCVQ